MAGSDGDGSGLFSNDGSPNIGFAMSDDCAERVMIGLPESESGASKSGAGSCIADVPPLESGAPERRGCVSMRRTFGGKCSRSELKESTKTLENC